MRNINKIERNLLVYSVYAAAVFSISGVIIGFLVKSQIILFDGIYSLISVALSLLSLAAAKFMSKNDWKQFPFGKTEIEPLVIIFKYTIILILVVVSFSGAFISLFRGGRNVQVDIAFIYSIIGTIGCYGLYTLLRKKSKDIHSGLLEAEANQWLMDTLVSTAVLIAFFIAVIFKRIPFLVPVVAYLDPVMVMLVSFYFIRLPLMEITNSIKEILSMSPDKEVKLKLQSIIKDIEDRYNLRESFLRVTKGRKILWLEIDFVVDTNSNVKTIDDQDKVREEIFRELNTFKCDKWLTVSFTKDRKWAI